VHKASANTFSDNNNSNILLSINGIWTIPRSGGTLYGEAKGVYTVATARDDRRGIATFTAQEVG
jgi:hypothetical protein